MFLDTRRDENFLLTRTGIWDRTKVGSEFLTPQKLYSSHKKLYCTKALLYHCLRRICKTQRIWVLSFNAATGTCAEAAPTFCTAWVIAGEADPAERSLAHQLCLPWEAGFSPSSLTLCAASVNCNSNTCCLILLESCCLPRSVCPSVAHVCSVFTRCEWQLQT
jgi:hypothetical protein